MNHNAIKTTKANENKTIKNRNSSLDNTMSANKWRFNDSGSADMYSSSFENIFAAYHDYRNSQQWN